MRNLVVITCFLMSAANQRLLWSGSPDHDRSERSEAIQVSLELIATAAKGSADQRKCFTCHGQAMPVVAMYEASQLGIEIDETLFARQVSHTWAHLLRGKKSYAEGKGQGGGVDTAGYALWTVEHGIDLADSQENGDPQSHQKREEIIKLVCEYLIDKQNKSGRWKHTSNRPPSEASSLTTTYLALRALNFFWAEENPDEWSDVRQRARDWLESVECADTEDRVFRYLACEIVQTNESLLETQISELAAMQRDDGGWSQLESMESDAYATGTVMYALHRSGFSTEDPAWKRGIDFLVRARQPDGSWHVTTRSDPFQKYFESGFPHGDDQFISTTASCWAVIALMVDQAVQTP